MKTSNNVSSSRRKSRKAHFSAPAHLKRKMMKAPLSQELAEKYKVKTLPIRKGDEVMIVRGDHHDREGRVIAVYRKKWVIHIERVTKEKSGAFFVPIGINPSKVVITKPFLTKNRTKYLKTVGAMNIKRKEALKESINQ